MPPLMEFPERKVFQLGIISLKTYPHGNLLEILWVQSDLKTKQKFGNGRITFLPEHLLRTSTYSIYILHFF